MTNTTLQRVLADLQPLYACLWQTSSPELILGYRVLPKLRAEQYAGPANSKKGSVDVLRGDHYQFAFFIRKVDSTSNVLIKSRRFVPAKSVAERQESPPVALGKRKRKAPNRPLKDEPETEQEPGPTVPQEDEDEEAGTPRRASPAGSEFHLEEEEEEKPKMELQLSYQGFSIFGRCLCVVVEPYPPLSESTLQRPKTPPPVERSILQPRASRAPSEHPRFREETPLFLPEIEPSGRDPTPHPANLAESDTRESRVPEESSNDKGSGQTGMMALTQLLQDTAMYRIDSDSDGDEAGVFLGDAEASRDIF